MMRNTPLLALFDERPSKLDPIGEAELFDRYGTTARLTSTTHGTITLLVSHRFATVD